MHIDGGCHCGYLAYEAEIDPDGIRICHCTDCQVFSGSAYSTFVTAPGESFRQVAGEPSIYVKTAESGNRLGDGPCGNRAVRQAGGPITAFRVPSAFGQERERCAMNPGNADTFEGACTCGAVRYRMTSRPLFVHGCHCSWCQRETGSAFAINAMIESDRVVLLQGEPEVINTPSNSGRGQKIARCASCRVALWSHYAGAGDAVRFVRVGTLLEPGRLPPDIHIFTSTKLPWVVLPPDKPAVPEFYDLKQYWPPDSLERRRALVARARAPGATA